MFNCEFVYNNIFLETSRSLECENYEIYMNSFLGWWDIGEQKNIFGNLYVFVGENHDKEAQKPKKVELN